MERRSYIGVTDFTSRDQVLLAKQWIHPGVKRVLHIGAMMSYKTMHGIKTRTGWENIWLNGDQLQALFVEDDSVFNVLHYADYDNPSPTQVQDLHFACLLAGNGISGLQLDMVWPDPRMLREFVYDKPKNLSLILQVSKPAIREIQEEDIPLRSQLEEYKGLVHYILIDYGMGRGTPFDPQEMLSLVDIAVAVFGESGVAVGGGLGPDTYTNLQPILQKYPGISWDAQGRLRKSGKATDPLDMDLVKLYLERSSALGASYL